MIDTDNVFDGEEDFEVKFEGSCIVKEQEERDLIEELIEYIENDIKALVKAAEEKEKVVTRISGCSGRYYRNRANMLSKSLDILKKQKHKKEKLKDMINKSYGAFQHLVDENNKLKEQLGDAEEYYMELEERIRMLEEENKTLNSAQEEEYMKNGEKTVDICKVQTRCDFLEKDNEYLKGEIKRLEGEIEGLEKYIGNRKEYIEDLEDHFYELEDRTSELEKGNAVLNKANTDLAKDNAALEAEIKSLKEDRGGMYWRTKAGIFEKRCEELREENVRLEDEIEELKEYDAELRKVNLALDEDNRTLKKVNTEMAKENAALERANVEVNKENSALLDRIEELKECNEALEYLARDLTVKRIEEGDSFYKNIYISDEHMKALTSEIYNSTAMLASLAEESAELAQACSKLVKKRMLLNSILVCEDCSAVVEEIAHVLICIKGLAYIYDSINPSSICEEIHKKYPKGYENS